MLLMQGPWVQSLVGELSSHMPDGTAKKKKREEERQLKLKHLPRCFLQTPSGEPGVGERPLAGHQQV